MDTKEKVETYTPFQVDRARALSEVMRRRCEVHRVLKEPGTDELIFYREVNPGQIELGVRLGARPFMKALGHIAMSLFEDLSGTGPEGQRLALDIMESNRIARQ